MPYNRPTPNEILNQIQSELDIALPGADARLRNSVENVFARLISIAAYMFFGFLEWNSRQIFVSTADAENVDRHASEWGIQRKAATQATGTVQFTGVNGSTVPAGTILIRSDNTEYILDADAIISAGTALGHITAIILGAAGSTAAGTKLSLGNPVAGIQNDAIVQSQGLTGGFDIESDALLRSRVLERKQKPPQGGSKDDYERWAKEVAGVTRAWAYPLQLGLGTVEIIFVMDDKVGTIIPSAGEIANVKSYIETVRPIGAEVTVIAPTPVAVDFEIDLNPNSIAVQNAVKAEIEDLFRREALPGGTLFLSRIQEAISTATGEFDHVLVQPAANVEMDFGELPVVGAFTWGSI